MSEFISTELSAPNSSEHNILAFRFYDCMMARKLELMQEKDERLAKTYIQQRKQLLYAKQIAMRKWGFYDWTINKTGLAQCKIKAKI